MRASEMSLAARCRGYASLKSPVPIGNEFSVAGTAFHEMARAKVLGENIPFDAIRLKYGFSEEEFSSICAALFNIQIAIPKGSQHFCDDRRLHSTSMDLAGQPDFVLLNRNILTVIDWKSGWGDVDDPQHNHQLISYAVLVMENFQSLFKGSPEDVDFIDLMIVLPKRNVIKAHRFKKDEIMETARMVLAGIITESTEAAEPEFTIGSHCAGCYRNMTCPAFAHEITQLSIYAGGAVGELKVEAISRLVPLCKAAVAIHNKVMSAAKVWVDIHGPLDLGGGAFLVKETVERDEIQIAEAYPVLKEHFGDDVMTLFSVTKTFLKDACKGRPRGFYKCVYDALAANGGITKTERTEYQVQKGGVTNGKQEHREVGQQECLTNAGGQTVR